MWQWKWIAQRLPQAYKLRQQPTVTKKASKVIAQELINYLPEYQHKLRKDKSVADGTKDVKRSVQELPEYYKFIKFVEKRRWKLQARQHRL